MLDAQREVGGPSRSDSGTSCDLAPILQIDSLLKSQTSGSLATVPTMMDHLIWTSAPGDYERANGLAFRTGFVFKGLVNLRLLVLLRLVGSVLLISSFGPLIFRFLFLGSGAQIVSGT